MRGPWSEVLKDFDGTGMSGTNSVDRNCLREREDLPFIRYRNSMARLTVGEFKVCKLTAAVNDCLHEAIGIFERYGFHDNGIRKDLDDLESGSFVQLELAGKEINEAAVARIINTVSPLLRARADTMTIRVSGDLIQIIKNKL